MNDTAPATTMARMAADHAFVVLAYKQSPFLDGCLDGLAAQTIASRTVIATSTPCAHIAEAAARRGLGMIVNPVSAGIASDFNFALRATDARFVTLVHQDDTYAPAFLEATLGEFARHDGVLCFTSYQEIDDHGRPMSSRVSKAKHLIEFFTLGPLHVARGLPLRAFLSFGDPLPCSSVTFDMTKLEGFAFSSEFRANLDWDAWWRLRAAGHTFLRAPHRLVGRRHNDLTETSKLLRNGVRKIEDLAMFRRAWPRPIADALAFVYRAGY